MTLRWFTQLAIKEKAMKSMCRKTKRFIKTVVGRDLMIKKDCLCNYKRVGSQYGGWDLVVDQLDKHSIVYSFGIGEDTSFDMALIEELGVAIHAFDPTPKSIQWVKAQHFSPSFVMHEYGIANIDGSVAFSPPKNPDHISHTILERAETKDQAIKVPVKRLKTIMKDLQHHEVDLLKMDIEGAEYAVIRDMESMNIRPRQLLIEFHHRFPNVGIKKTKEALNLLKNMGYGLFSVSESGEEYSFIYKNDLQPFEPGLHEAPFRSSASAQGQATYA